MAEPTESARTEPGRTEPGRTESGRTESGRIAVVGLAGASMELNEAARRAVENATLLVGAPRHLERVGSRWPAAGPGPEPGLAGEPPAPEADAAPVATPPQTQPPSGLDEDSLGGDSAVTPVAQDQTASGRPSSFLLAPNEPAEGDVAPERPVRAERSEQSEQARAQAPQRVIVLGTDGLGGAGPLDGAGAMSVSGALDAIGAESGPVCVLASGDPGFFGIVRALVERFGAGALDVQPAPSSVSLAFARLGLAWDDAVVVSAHGRPLASAARAILAHPKVAVLTSPEAPPQQLGRALMDLGVDPRRVTVCSQLGEPDEAVRQTDLVGLAGRSWDPLSVVVLLAAGAEVAPEAVLAWGLADEGFAHRGGMLTRAEVRAVALGKLGLPVQGVLWDVGAGSGSVAVECARLRPGLRVIAVEERDDDAARVEANALAHRASVEVVRGAAPGALAGLPDPDRAFVGGGGLGVLDAVLARLRPGGQVVATYAALDRAAAAVERLGQLVQIGVARGRRLADGGVRLAAENPIFVVWGPQQ